MATDNDVRALPERYACLVPFHEVRTRFLGNIAAPGPQAAPIKAVQGLWGGKLPEFESMEAVNELLGALIMGFVEPSVAAPRAQQPVQAYSLRGSADTRGAACLGPDAGSGTRRASLKGYLAREGLPA